MNLFHDGIDWMRSQLLASVSIEVTYHRNTSSVTLSAVVGTTTFEAVNEYGIVERVQTRDYLIPSKELILGGSPTLPMAGDRITEGAREFEVTAQGGEPAFRYSDPSQTILRIHTKGVH
jgi:hypothetical protein